MKTEKDCFTLKGATICAAPHADYDVDIYTMHPDYNMQTLKNDIALIKTKRTVSFTGWYIYEYFKIQIMIILDYIQPICLPFERSLEKRSLVGQRLTISGWGKTDASKVILKRVTK